MLQHAYVLQRQQCPVGHYLLVTEQLWKQEGMEPGQQTIDWDDTYQSGTQRTSRSYLSLLPVAQVLLASHSMPWCAAIGYQVSQDHIGRVLVLVASRSPHPRTAQHSKMHADIKAGKNMLGVRLHC